MGTRSEVFVSSTFDDLKEYRDAAFQAIHRLFGYTDDMLFWTADERDAVTVSLDRLKQCDLVILIMAHRYGYVPEGQQYSLTELEYRTARKNKIPILAFVVDDKTPWLVSNIETKKAEELAKFKELVGKEAVWSTFTSRDDLSAKVTAALHVFLERHRQELEQGKQFQSTLLTKSHAELK